MLHHQRPCSFGASLGFMVSHGYGLTKTGTLVESCAWKKQWNNFPASERAILEARKGVRTIGLVEVDVVNPASGKCVKKEMGLVISKNLSPDGTSKCMKNDGLFYTGDVGVMHPDGYLEIKDQSKDVIFSGG